jgi:hypothetical protein
MQETPKRRWFRFSLRSVFVVIAVLAMLMAAIVGVRHYSWHYDWAMIQRATRLQAMQNVYDVNMMLGGPAWHEQLWAVVQCRIPPEDIADFIEQNHCEPSERVELKRYRKVLPREVQTLPLSGDHFYKSGDTTTGKPYEILADSSGLVVVYMMLDD